MFESCTLYSVYEVALLRIFFSLFFIFKPCDFLNLFLKGNFEFVRKFRKNIDPTYSEVVSVTISSKIL